MGRFLAAWAAWDRDPGKDETARAFEAECARVAREQGRSTNDLRRALAAHRRAGLTREEAAAAEGIE